MPNQSMILPRDLPRSDQILHDGQWPLHGSWDFRAWGKGIDECLNYILGVAR